MESSTVVGSSSVVTSSSSYTTTSKGSSSSTCGENNSNSSGNSKLSSSSSAVATSSGRVTHVEDINDENLLREMWVEAGDGESKRQIRSRMYKLREERLKDFYNRENILENILKDDHASAAPVSSTSSDLEVTDVKTTETEARKNGATITSSKTVTTLGNASGTASGMITTTTTKAVVTNNNNTNATGGGGGGDEEIKYVGKIGINQHQRSLNSRKSSQEINNGAAAHSIAVPSKIKSSSTTTTSTTTSFVAKKNSVELGNGSGGQEHALDTKSKLHITKSNGSSSNSNNNHNRILTVAKQEANLNKLNANKSNIHSNGSGQNGHSGLGRTISSNNNIQQQHEVINGKQATGSKTVTKTVLKTKLSSSSNNNNNSGATNGSNTAANANNNVNNNNNHRKIEKKSSVSRTDSQSQQQREESRTFSTTASHAKNSTSSSSHSTTANSMKLTKGLHSPPVTKKETTRVHNVEIIEKSMPTTTTATLPRFMSTTKSREIGIASTHEKFSNIHQSSSVNNTSTNNSGKVTALNVNLVHRQDSAGKSSASNKATSAKPKQTATKSVSNDMEEKQPGTSAAKPNEKGANKSPSSRETSPKNFKQVSRKDSEKSIAGTGAVTMKTGISTSTKVIKTEESEMGKKEVGGIKKSGNKTEESIIEELDNLDNYLYQRSKSIEEKNKKKQGLGDEMTATPIIIIGNVDGEGQAEAKVDGGEKEKVNGETKQVTMRTVHKLSSSGTGATSSSTTSSSATGTSQKVKRNNSGGSGTGRTHAKQIELSPLDDDKNTNNNISSSKNNNNNKGQAALVREDVMVSGVEPKFTKTKAKTYCNTGEVNENESCENQIKRKISKEKAGGGGGGGGRDVQHGKIEEEIIKAKKSSTVSSTKNSSVAKSPNVSTNKTENGETTQQQDQQQQQQQRSKKTTETRTSAKASLTGKTQGVVVVGDELIIQTATSPANSNLLPMSGTMSTKKDQDYNSSNNNRQQQQQQRVVRKESSSSITTTRTGEIQRPRTSSTDSTDKMSTMKNLKEQEKYDADILSRPSVFDKKRLYESQLTTSSTTTGESVLVQKSSSASSEHKITTAGRKEISKDYGNDEKKARHGKEVETVDATGDDDGNVPLKSSSSSRKSLESPGAVLKAKSLFENKAQEAAMDKCSNSNTSRFSPTLGASFTVNRKTALFEAKARGERSSISSEASSSHIAEESSTVANATETQAEKVVVKKTTSSAAGVEIQKKVDGVKTTKFNAAPVGTSETPKSDRGAVAAADKVPSTTGKSSGNGALPQQQQPRRRSSAEFLETVDDVVQLEALLYQATDYDERSRIRARIRSIKRSATLNKKSGDSKEKVDYRKFTHVASSSVQNKGTHAVTTNETKTTAVKQQSYGSRKSSEEFSKSPQRRRSSEHGSEEEGRKRRASSRKSSGESGTVAAAGASSAIITDVVMKSGRKVSGERTMKKTAATPEVQEKDNQVRKISNERNSAMKGEHSSVVKLMGQFEKASTEKSETLSKLSLKGKLTKNEEPIQARNKTEEIEKDVSVSESTVPKKNSRDESLYSTRKSPAKDDQGNVDSTKTSSTGEAETGAKEKRRFPSNKSNKSTDGEQEKSSPTTFKNKGIDDGLVEDESHRKIEISRSQRKTFHRKPSNESEGKSPSRKSSNELSDVEILTPQQLNDIKRRTRDTSSQEKELKHTTAAGTRRKSAEKQQENSSNQETGVAKSSRKSSTEEENVKQTEKKSSSYVRRNSSKELKTTASATVETKKSSASTSESAKTKTTAKNAGETQSVSKLAKPGSISQFSPGKKTSTTTKSKSPAPTDGIDSVTSSYGVGPVDEDGTPLFGLRALRKIKQVQEQQVVVESKAAAEQEEEEEGKVDLRKSDLYGLRALKRAHEGDDSGCEDSGITSTTITTASTTSRMTKSSAGNFDHDNHHHDDGGYKKLGSSTPELKHTTSPPPPATSPKSILKKTSSFSSNKSESKSDLNTDREIFGTCFGSPTFNSSGGGGTRDGDGTFSPDMPSSKPHSDRSRSNSSDDSANSGSCSIGHPISISGTMSRGKVGRSSVKEMSKKFEKTETYVGDGHAFAPHNNKDQKLALSKAAAAAAASDDGKNVVYTKTSRIQKMELKDDEENDGQEYENKIDEEEREESEDGIIVTKTTNKTMSRSFLTDRTPVTNLNDVLERMKGENGNSGGSTSTTTSSTNNNKNTTTTTKTTTTTSSGEGKADAADDDEEAAAAAAGLNLLNKFIGSQILLSGVEPLLKASGGGCSSTTSKTTTMSLVINGVDIDQEADAAKLRSLLDDCDGVEERGRIETRLKTLGSTALIGQSGTSQAMISSSSSKMVKQASKQSSSTASADVTGELMPLILGQLQNSLHNMSSVSCGSDNKNKHSNDGDGGNKQLQQTGQGNSSSSGGAGPSKTQSNNSLIDGRDSSAASSLCNSNNNSSATLVDERIGSTQECAQAPGEDGGSSTPDEDECLFDSGTESGEDAPPVSSTYAKPPSSSLNTLISSSSTTTSSSTPASTNNTNANKLVSKNNTSAAPVPPPRKKSEPSSTAGEFNSFMEGLRHSLQQSASALVLSSLQPTSKESSRRGKGISIGGGRTSSVATSAAAAPKTPTDSDLIQQVDSVLSLLKDSLIKDPNYLEKKLSGPLLVDSSKGKELIALIDRLKSSLQSTKQETPAVAATAVGSDGGKKAVCDEPKPPDLLPVNPPEKKAAKVVAPASASQEQKISGNAVEPPKVVTEKPPPSSSSSSSLLLEEVPWKIRAAKKRAQGRSRSIGVSQEELEEARRFLQEEAFRSALKEGEKTDQQQQQTTTESYGTGSTQGFRAIPGFRPMGWKGDVLNSSPSPFVLANGATADKEAMKRFQITSSVQDDSSTLGWNKFGLFKPHKPFRTFSLDNNQQGEQLLSSALLIHDDPSSLLFTPQEVVQIEIHRAAIKKQMSDEEERRRRRNSISSLQSVMSDDGRSPNKPRDFSLALPKPYANPNTSAGSVGNKTGSQLQKQQLSGSNTTSACPTPTNPITGNTTTDDDEQQQQQMVLYDTSSARSTPTPLHSPTKRSSIDNVQISLKDLTSNMIPQLQIAITVNTNNNNSVEGGIGGKGLGTGVGGPPCGAIAGPNAVTGTTSSNSSTPRATPSSKTGGTGVSGGEPSKGNNSSSGGSSISGTRYKNKNERKRRMKRANTIDIPQPYDSFGNESPDEECDDDGEDEDDDDERMSDFNGNKMKGNSNSSSNSKNNPSVGSNPNPGAASSSGLGFIPKTESDKKFYAFLEKNQEQELRAGSAARFNRPLSHLTVDHRNSHFSNLKTSFESSTSQGSSPSMSPVPSSTASAVSPSARHLINPEDILIGKQQQSIYSSKPIWAAKPDPLLAKSSQSVKNKLHVFETPETLAPPPHTALASHHHGQHPHELWKSGSPEVEQHQPLTGRAGYQPQTKPSSLLAKKESFEKFAEEHSQPQFHKPIPAVRSKVKQVGTGTKAQIDEPLLAPAPPLPPKTGVHIVHATKSAMDALARQRVNFSPVQAHFNSGDVPPVVPPRHLKSLPSSPTIEKSVNPWNKTVPTVVQVTEQCPVSRPAAPTPQFTNPKVQLSREMFEAKQREAVLTPIPHPPPQSHINVTVPIHQQQQKSTTRLDLPSATSRLYEEEGMTTLTGRSPYISVKKLEMGKYQNLPGSKNTDHQSSSSPSPGQVEKISVVFQPIAHGKSLDSSSNANYLPLQSGHIATAPQLHPKLAVFGVTRSIDDEKVVKGRLELESNKSQKRNSQDFGSNSQGIVNTAFAPLPNNNKTSAFIARKFEGQNIEPLPALRRQSIPNPTCSTDGPISPCSPGATLISPVVSKVMKGPQQQRATVTRKEMTSLGSDHPSAHRIRGDSIPSAASSGQQSQSTQPTADTARLSIGSIIGKFQQQPDTTASCNTDSEKRVPGKVFPRQLASGGLAPSLPLKKSHSGDALLQTHFLHGQGSGGHHHHHHHGRTSHFIPTSTIQQQQLPEEVPTSPQGKFQPFQAHGFVQARSRFLDQKQPVATPLTQPTQPQQLLLQKQQPVSVQQQIKSWGPQLGGVGVAPASTGSPNPFIPRQRSLSHFPPSVGQTPGVGVKPVTQEQNKPNKLNLSSFASLTSHANARDSSPAANHVHKIRFPQQPIQLPHEQQQQQRSQSPHSFIADALQRTSSGSSIFDRTQSLYISTQDSMGGGVKPKRRPPPSALPKSKTLFPKQYEAQMSPESADQKKREVEAFFKNATAALNKEKPTIGAKSSSSTSASSHYRKLRHQQSHDGNESGASSSAAAAASSYGTRIRKSASQGKLMHRQRSLSEGEDDVDQIFESLFNTAVESKLGRRGEELTTVTASAAESKKQQQSQAQCQVQRQESGSIMQSSGADGSSSTKTVKQASSKTSASFKSSSSSSTASATASVTASGAGAAAVASPFSKFKQLDQQNSPATTGSKSGGPMFKLTNPASATSAKDVLLYWCQCRVRDYQNVKMENFSSSWSDGLAFCALIHHFYPDAFDYTKLDAKNRRHNFTLAFRVAEEKAGIYPILDVEDMMVMGKKPDWKCVFTYVQSMYRTLKNMS